MLEIRTDNDEGINQGRAANRWRATVYCGPYQVLSTGFDYGTSQDAMGGAQKELAGALRWAVQASQHKRLQVFDQDAFEHSP